MSKKNQRDQQISTQEIHAESIERSQDALAPKLSAGRSHRYALLGNFHDPSLFMYVVPPVSWIVYFWHLYGTFRGFSRSAARKPS